MVGRLRRSGGVEGRAERGKIRDFKKYHPSSVGVTMKSLLLCNSFSIEIEREIRGGEEGRERGRGGAVD